MVKSALLVLEDGTQFHGRAIGATGSAVREIVFNASTTGCQGILTDPLCSRQTVTLIYPRIGSVGTSDTDEESSQVHAQGLVIHDLPLIASNFHNTEGLPSYLKRHSIVAIAGIDARKLACLLRKEGAQNNYIIAGDNPDAALALEKAHAFPGLNSMGLAEGVITAGPYNWTQGSWALTGDLPEAKKEDELPYHIVAYGFGAKHSILRMLVGRGYRLTIVPVQISAEDVLKMNPDDTFLSNGPGDPAPHDYVVTTIQKSLGTDIPVFGICFDHQLLTLASGAKIVRTRFGHHDDNHLVKDAEKNMVMIIAQDHGFTVNEATLSVDSRVTHKSLFDGTLRDIHRTGKSAFSLQGHPKASPGPYDAAPLFDHSIALAEQHRRIAR